MATGMQLAVNTDGTTDIGPVHHTPAPIGWVRTTTVNASSMAIGKGNTAAWSMTTVGIKTTAAAIMTMITTR